MACSDYSVNALKSLLILKSDDIKIKKNTLGMSEKRTKFSPLFEL